MAINENIKKLRVEKKLTQKELSALTGISEVMISQYERGIRIPKNRNLRKLASVLDATGSILLGEELPFDLVSPNDNLDNYESPIAVHANTDLELYEHKLLNNYRLLNEEGKKEANKRVEELTEITRYQKKKTKENGDKLSPLAP